MAESAFRVNGKDYPMPTSFTVGEMCDAERYFGVEFGADTSKSNMRMAAAMLWIAIRREDPTVTIDDVRALPPEVFAAAEADANPPTEGAPDTPSELSGPSSENGSGQPEAVLSNFGVPDSATGATSDPAT